MLHTHEATGSSPVVSTKKKSLEPLRFQGFSLFSQRSLPFIYPLEQFFDKALHPLGALATHLVGDMAIDVQGEDRRGVAQVFLHGLDVVPALDGGHGVAVPQIWICQAQTNII